MTPVDCLVSNADSSFQTRKPVHAAARKQALLRGVVAVCLFVCGCGGGAEDARDLRDLGDVGDVEQVDTVTEAITGGIQTASDFVVQIGNCSGVILNSFTLMTAAHCFDSDGTHQVKVVRTESSSSSPGSFTYTRKCVADPCTFAVDVIRHPDHAKYVANDYALLITSVGMGLKAARAPLLRMMESHKAGFYAIMSMGPKSATDTGKRYLRVATVDIEKFEWWLAFDKIYTHDAVHICEGDSGAPLIYETATIDGKLRTAVGAIVTQGDGSVRTCMSNGTAYYATTYANAGWIDAHADGGCSVVSDNLNRTYLDCSH